MRIHQSALPAFTYILSVADHFVKCIVSMETPGERSPTWQQQDDAVLIVIIEGDFSSLRLLVEIIIINLVPGGRPMLGMTLPRLLAARRHAHQHTHARTRRVTWGKGPPFGDYLSLTYLFASTSEKRYVYVTNYMLCV